MAIPVGAAPARRDEPARQIGAIENRDGEQHRTHGDVVDERRGAHGVEAGSEDRKDERAGHDAKRSTGAPAERHTAEDRTGRSRRDDVGQPEGEADARL